MLQSFPKKHPLTRFNCAGHNFIRMDNKKALLAIYRNPLSPGYAFCIIFIALESKTPLQSIFFYPV